MKKIISGLFIAIVMIGLFAACSDSDVTKEDASKEVKNKMEEMNKVKSDDEKITMKRLHQMNKKQRNMLQLVRH